MRFSLDWLFDHLETTASVTSLAQRLTALGLEVERVEDRAQGLADLVVGHIVAVDPHPNADRLRLCSVDTGKGKAPVRVVCGAPNARVGVKSLFAAPGSFIAAAGAPLRPSVIRGVKSCGMLCSAHDVGLGADHEGIMELAEDLVPGLPAVEALPDQSHPVIDIALTPNRADCTGVRGIARDLAAAGLGVLKPVAAVKPNTGGFPCPLSVHVDGAEACSQFQIRLMRGVKNGPSPDWLRNRLIASGLRPVSALVDITNYLTLDRARPLHVFDYAKVAGDLTVRSAAEGETLKALDGRDYPLSPGMTVIADTRGVLSLGGIIGGERSGCDCDTANVLIECAHFDPATTAATGRRLHIDSEARYRFERGVDPCGVDDGMAAATAMITDLCGGEASHVCAVGEKPPPRPAISFRPDRVRELGGIDVEQEACTDILRALGCRIDPQNKKNGATLSVTPPSWRGDVREDVDLVEEVLRVHGYDALAETALPRCLPQPVRDADQRRPGQVARLLAARGLVEAVTWSFMDADQAALFGGTDPRLRLTNPISRNLDQLRPTPLASLVGVAARNLAAGVSDVAIFEVGPGFASPQAGDQSRIAAGVRVGWRQKRHWSGPAQAVDPFTVKADVLAVLATLDIAVDKLRVTRDAPPWFHPGCSGRLMLGPRVAVAQFGALHPRIAQAVSIKDPVVAFEIFLDALPAPKVRSRPPFSPPVYQPLTRDLAFVLAEDVAAADVVAAVATAKEPLVEAVDIFDVYTGTGVKKGTKSIALSLTLQPRASTLSDEDIEAAVKKVTDAIIAATGATLRDM